MGKYWFSIPKFYVKYWLYSSENDFFLEYWTSILFEKLYLLKKGTIFVSSYTNKNKPIQKNNTLKIRMKLKKMFNGAQTNVKVYYTGLDIIDANQGAVVISKDLIKQYELILKAQERAYI